MTSRRKKILVILSYGLISMLIGVVFQAMNCPECLKNISWVIRNLGYSLMLGYGLFMNKYLYDIAIEPFVSWFKKPVRSIFISFVSTTLYSAFVIFFTNWFWFTFIQEMPFGYFLNHHTDIWITEFVILYFISLWFYARAFFMDWKKEFQQREVLKREALSAKYDVLKSQVNPHFLFNSLNVAISLIDKDPAISKKFLTQLSGLYREVLELQDNDVVPLKRELKLAARYLYLQEMRFGRAFTYSLPSDDAIDGQALVPLSVQMLMENAFKHNRFSAESSMSINVSIENNHLIVRNNCYTHFDAVDSLNIGLENIRERYRYLTGKEIDVIKENGIFEVRIPLISES